MNVSYLIGCGNRFHKVFSEVIKNIIIFTVFSVKLINIIRSQNDALERKQFSQ